MADKKKAAVESAAPAADKKKALETAMAQIEKAYGKGSIMRLGDNADIVVEAIPTGSLSLDLALGIGGVPRGRIRSGAARWPSSTPSTPWIPTMPGPWGWTLTPC